MIEIKTSGRSEVLDITERVSQLIRESGVSDGIALVGTLHTTTGLAVNEADPALMRDMLTLLERMVPDGIGYEHDRGDGNAASHLRAMILGNSVTLPVKDGQLVLGAWQRILLFELDGPRRRTLFVRIIRDG